VLQITHSTQKNGMTGQDENNFLKVSFFDFRIMQESDHGMPGVCVRIDRERRCILI